MSSVFSKTSADQKFPVDEHILTTSMASNTSSQESILDKIVRKRLQDVEEAKSRVSLEELKTQLTKYPLIDFYERIQRTQKEGKTAILAEVKRASPSKGDIAPNINAAEQGLKYATAGASAISCLTEPTWFKGTLEDMRGIREAIDSMGQDKRPALLRKDFLMDEYQVYEARAYGADTLLLIVASFKYDQPHYNTLKNLLQCSRSLGMEPLMEVNNDEEMKVAIDIGSKIIGINNRNLHTFNVDLNTTTRLVEGATLPKDVIMVALSGINGREDVEFFEKIGVQAVLVGESLMRAKDPSTKILQLQGVVPELTSTSNNNNSSRPLVKICGALDVPTAILAAGHGADFIGLVFAESKRKVPTELAKEIVQAIHKFRKQGRITNLKSQMDCVPKQTEEWYKHGFQLVEKALQTCKPLVVGVFADNDTDYVNQIAEEVGLDIVQLSGHEGFQAATKTTVASFKAVHIGTSSTAKEVLQALEIGPMCLLLDTQDPNARGGTGRTFDWNIAKELAQSVPFFVAGGLSPANIAEAVRSSNAVAVDVSSGVETDGKKDHAKIGQFLQLAKSA